MIPPLVQVYLPCRGPGPLSFRSYGTAFVGPHSGMLKRLLSKGRLRLFPLNIAPVVVCVISQAVTVLWLFPWDAAHPEEVGSAYARSTGARIHSCAACVRSAGNACIAAGLWWPRTSQTKRLGVRNIGVFIRENVCLENSLSQ